MEDLVIVFLPMAIMGLLTIYFAWHDVKQHKKINKLKAELNHVKHKRYVREIGYDIEECEDCHLPNDCPLCGAT